jgi:DNA-binding transcriptional LysR family regulator
MHITLRQLEVFAEVLKSGSTTQASQMLALSQSAVSAALTDLEGQLGVQLFDRVGKRLVVNEHGRLLYPRALALLEQAIEIEQLFREDNGAIRVYASSTIGNYILPEVIARYRRDFPTLPLEMSVGNSQDVINAVIDFRVDIGLIEGPCHNVDIIAEPWLEDELVVFASPASSLLQGEVTLERWRRRSGSCASRAPARVKLSIICCCPICRISSWGWSWGTQRRSSTRCVTAWVSAVFPGALLPNSLKPDRWLKFRFRCRNWCARCGAFIIARNTFPARCSVFCAIAKSDIVPHPKGRGKNYALLIILAES